jgi:hypothetical protein
MTLCYDVRDGIAGMTVIEITILFSVPAALIYGWIFYLTRMRTEPASWRNRSTLLSLTLVSLVALLWPVMLVLIPRADWERGIGVAHQIDWIESWHRPVLRTLLLALVLGALGRPALLRQTLEFRAVTFPEKIIEEVYAPIE